MRPISRVARGYRTFRSPLAMCAVGLALQACSESPDPPQECTALSLADVGLEWQRREPLRRAANLDSLRAVIVAEYG